MAVNIDQLAHNHVRNFGSSQSLQDTAIYEIWATDEAWGQYGGYDLK